MDALEEQTVYCPYCGEPISVLVDSSGGSQQYIEDCQVCCQPIVFHLSVDLDGDTTLAVFSEDDSFS